MYKCVVALLVAISAQVANAQDADVNSQPQPQTNSNAQAQNIPAPGTRIPVLPKLPNVANEAYKQTLDSKAPLSPEQIKDMRKYLDDSERAASSLPRFVPRPVQSSVTVTLEPGETPPVARLYSDCVTNILFVDQTGNPLSVSDVSPGGGNKNFSIAWSKNNNSVAPNAISISPNSTYAIGNLSVFLVGIDAPVSVTLISGQREVDYRVDVHVKTRRAAGGHVGNSVAASLPAEANAVMLNMLEGVAPEGARTLHTSMPDVKAWQYNNKFYIRMPYPLLSPAWTAMRKSADGTTVYEIPSTPVVVGLFGGATNSINISGY